MLLGTLTVGLGVAGCGGHTTHTTQSSPTGTATGSTPSSSAESPTRATGSPAVVASGIPFPVNLAFDSSGRLWVGSGAAGTSTLPGEGIWYVPAGGAPRRVAGGLPAAGALTWIGDRLDVGNNVAPGQGQITVLSGFTGTEFTGRHVLVAGLNDGSHIISAIVPGASGLIYTPLGAAGDHSGPPGNIVSVSTSGGTPTVVATGIGDVFGLAFWGQRLLVTLPGPHIPEAPPSRLQSFAPGGQVVDFGFPKCYGQEGSACAPYPAPLAILPAHSAPTSVVVKGDVAYVAENGSSTPGYPVSSQIERVDLRTGDVNVFWRSPVAHDLVDLALGPDGNLYAALFVSGKVVRLDL